MGENLNIILLAVSLVVLVVLAFMLRKPLRFLACVVVNLILGLAIIVCLNWLFPGHIAIPVNIYTIICSACLGGPGALVLAAVQLFL